jgi:flagellar biosynthetic protein FliO
VIDAFVLAQTATPGIAGPDLMPSLWRMAGALVVVLALLAGLAWLLRRGNLLRRRSSGMGIESAISLGERRSLVVVSVEGRRLLVGLAPNHVSLVTELGPAPFEQALAEASGSTGPVSGSLPS